jgi:hypothetical protein
VVITALALAALAGFRLACLDGLLRRVTIEGASMAPTLLGAHLEIQCGDCAFRFLCDAEHLPSDYRYACPNCGSIIEPPSLATLRPAQMVLIDYWPLLWRRPRRWEVVAARLPGGEVTVKRIAWLAGEQPAIQDGELYNADQLLQKVPRDLKKMRQLVHDDRYRPESAAATQPRWRGADPVTNWRHEHDTYAYSPPRPSKNEIDWLTYHHWPGTFEHSARTTIGPITDNDPFNQGEAPRTLHEVRDCLLTCRVRAHGSFCLATTDGDQRFEIEIHPGENVELRRAGESLVMRPLPRLAFAQSTNLEFGLCDHQIFLVIRRETILVFPYDSPAPSTTLHPLQIGARSGELEVTHLQVWRDIHYLDHQGLSRPWSAGQVLPEDQIALLGDNQVVSLDSRTWESPGIPVSRLLGVVYPQSITPHRPSAQ